MEKRRILIVDDVQKNIQVLANTLSELYDIEYTTDGYDAVKWVKSEPFDLVLLDIMMPSIDGFGICKKIREDDTLDDMPVIFLTAKTDNDSIVKGFQSGGQDYILKPFNSEELKERIKTHIELKASREKLKNVNQWLEEQVQLKTEELQRAYKELELLDTAKDEFLMLLGHELRTPLNGIKGFTDILKENVESDTLLQYLNIIDNSSERLVQFAHEATLITSLRMNKYKIERVNTELVSFFEQLISVDFKDRMQKKSVDIKLNSNSKSVFIQADRNLLREAFSQLIENALNFSSRESVVDVDVLRDDDTLMVKIRDKGRGFSNKALEKMFRPFVPGEEHVDQNIGLGLHLVKLIMDAHNAGINIGNNQEGGAFVDVSFSV